jgi:hypothetical protein
MSQLILTTASGLAVKTLKDNKLHNIWSREIIIKSGKE